MVKKHSECLEKIKISLRCRVVLCSCLDIYMYIEYHGIHIPLTRLQSVQKVYSLQSTVYSLQSTVYSLQSFFFFGKLRWLKLKLKLRLKTCAKRSKIYMSTKTPERVKSKLALSHFKVNPHLKIYAIFYSNRFIMWVV